MYVYVLSRVGDPSSSSIYMNRESLSLSLASKSCAPSLLALLSCFHAWLIYASCSLTRALSLCLNLG